MHFLNQTDGKRRMTMIILAAAAISVIALSTFMVTTSAQAADPEWKAAITGVSLSGGDDPGDLRITWDEHPENQEEYRVAWAPDGENFRGHNNSDWNAYPTGTSLAVSGLTAGARYKVKVRARFASGKKSGGRDVPFRYYPRAGTATAGDDYTEPSGSTTITIPAGMRTASILVPTIIDNTDEGGGSGTEEMEVVISYAPYTTITRNADEKPWLRRGL